MEVCYVEVIDGYVGGFCVIFLFVDVWKGLVFCNFNWQVSYYIFEMVWDVKYFCDFEEEDVMFFRFDVIVVGVGIVVCGLGVCEDLLVKIEEVSFGFVLEVQ